MTIVFVENYVYIYIDIPSTIGTKLVIWDQIDLIPLKLVIISFSLDIWSFSFLSKVFLYICENYDSAHFRYLDILFYL